MLSKRISVVFNYLGCNNSDVARFAECSAYFYTFLNRSKVVNR